MKKGSFIFIVIFCFHSLSAQIFPTNLELTSRFNSRVKLLDEFIKRFNYAEKNKELDQYPPTYQFAYLFNLENKEMISKQESKDFVLMLSNDTLNKKLSFFKEGLFAVLNSKFLYKGRTIDIRFILKIRVSEKGYAWVISKIDPISQDSNFVTKSIDTISKYHSINPVDNEVNFIRFSELLRNKQITNKNFETDNDNSIIQKYLTFLNDKEVKFESFSNVQYHFFQIDNYHFTLDFFLRPNNNSGWLISSLSKITLADKEQLINTLFR